MAAETVSVIIPCYNHGRFLAEAVESVLAQTHPVAEILVVDDGSTDNTREVAESFGDRVRYVWKANAGLAAARNTGMEHVSGEFVNFLDADDRLMPEKIEKQLQVFRDDPAAALVYCWYVFTDERNQVIETVRREPHRGHVYHALRGGNWMPVHTVLVRTEALREVGPAVETLRSCEDWEVWLRIALKHPINLVDEPLVEYRNLAGSMSKSYWRMVCHTFRVLQLHRNDHPRCAECRRADRQTHVQYGKALKLHAWRAQTAGNLREAAEWYARAFRIDPGSLAAPQTLRDLAALGLGLLGRRAPARSE